MQITSKKGFTLIELLVVITIIGILSSIVLASLESSRKKGRDARRLSDIKQIQLALELYYDQNSAFPPSISSAANSCGTQSCASLYLTGPGYISVMPNDPSNQRDYSYASYGASAATATCISYHLGASLETSNHTALQQDKDQNDSNAPPTGMAICSATYAPSAGFNGTDTSKCNNNDTGVACYDVMP